MPGYHTQLTDRISGEKGSKMDCPPFMSGLDGFFYFIDLYNPFQELSEHTKIVIGVKKDVLFEYEVEKVI